MGRLVARLRLLTALGSPWLLAPALAHALDAPSDEVQAEERRNAAKAKFQEGAQAYEQGHYKDAVDAFLAADRLAPSAPLSFNVARAYEKLGDGSSALRWYRDYLRRNPNAQNAAGVRALIGTLAQELAKKNLQQLSVLSVPSGATVTIDDQPLGVTPWTGELAPGKHHLLLTSRGYRDAASDFELAATEPRDVSVHLEASADAPGATTGNPAPAGVAPAPPPATAPPPEPARGAHLGKWPWVVVGAGALSLGGSLTFELLRRSSESDAKRETTQLGYQSKLDTIHGQMVTSRVLLGVGGALVLTGGVLLLVDHGSGSGRSVSFACVPGACGALAQGRF